MPRIRWSLLLALASGLSGCDVSIEVDPGADFEFESAGGDSEHHRQAEARSLERRIESLEQQIEQHHEQKWALPASFSPAVAAEEERLDQQIEQLEAELEHAQEKLYSLEERARRASEPPDGLH